GQRICAVGDRAAIYGNCTADIGVIVVRSSEGQRGSRRAGDKILDTDRIVRVRNGTYQFAVGKRTGHACQRVNTRAAIDTVIRRDAFIYDDVVTCAAQNRVRTGTAGKVVGAGAADQ